MGTMPMNIKEYKAMARQQMIRDRGLNQCIGRCLLHHHAKSHEHQKHHRKHEVLRGSEQNQTQSEAATRKAPIQRPGRRTAVFAAWVNAWEDSPGSITMLPEQNELDCS
jgi:hypothetical protein